MKSNWFKGIWVVLLIGFFMQCEVANNSSTQETVNETEQIKQQFNLKLFEDALPQNSSVNWASPNKTYSERLKSMYVEFPITYEKISASGSGTTKTPPQYSIIAVREASGYKFYLAKFLSNTSISENQNVMLSNADSFTGIAMLLNRELEAEHVFGLDKGKIKATGSQISKESYEEIKSGKLKMSVDCYTEVVHHYTDWYQEYSDGTVAYIYTEYNGSTETQVCYDDPPTGSGGGGGGSGTDNNEYDEFLNKLIKEYDLLEGPCDEIENYKSIAEFTPPQEVMDILEFFQENYNSNFSLLDIENASGTVVNMDEFSVTISDLPDEMNASQLLNYIRLKINNFINTDYSEFSEYDFESYSGFYHRRWGASDPTGSILNIDIPGDNGSVIVSDYSSSNWTFSTIRSPWGYDHPVSGNREFGYTLNGNGSYTFYTKGVDRFTQSGLFGEWGATVLGGGDPFAGADNLWKSFQEGIKNYVEDNGGSATINDPEFIRPDWEQVLKVFEGEADISTIGCN